MPKVKNVQEYRVMHCLTIEKLAEKADVSVSTVKAALRGDNISLSSKAALARALHCKLEELTP